MSNWKLIVNFYIVFSIVVFILALILFFSTRKYKNSKIKLLGLFLVLNKRDNLLLATIFLGLLLNVFCALNIKHYTMLFVGMILFNSLISVLISFDFKYIVFEILFTSIGAVVLKLLNVIDVYLTNIHYDIYTHVLSIVFMIGIIVYAFFVAIKKLDMVLRKHKFVGR